MVALLEVEELEQVSRVIYLRKYYEIKIETDRLILRKISINDANFSFKNWMSDRKVTKFLRWKSHDNIDESKRIIKEWIKSYDNPYFFQWVIELKEINEPIGNISVVDYKEMTRTCHIGYAIGSKFWNKGYTSEAFLKVIEYLFSIGINRIESQHDPLNKASGRVMEKCGLKYEGCLKKADYNNRGIVDVLIYAIVKETIS